MTGVLAVGCIAVGLLLAIQNLIRLTAGRAKPEMTEPGARHWALANMGSGLLTVAAGLALLPALSKHWAAERWARLAGLALLGFAVAWWLRSPASEVSWRDNGGWAAT
jgi:hypothetical protein